jgi:CDP-diacylglycerol--glycerol-3-phosphate 3-phosphatidyltransferase
LRIFAIPLLGYLQFGPEREETGIRWLAFVVFTLASISDLVDGKIARSQNQITTFGVIADPIADKGLIAMALVGLSWSGRSWWWVTILILIREVLVTGYRLLMVRRRVIPADQGGKLKTVFQDVAVGAMLMPVAGWWLWFSDLAMGVALLLTLVTGVLFFWRVRRS